MRQGSSTSGQKPGEKTLEGLDSVSAPAVVVPAHAHAISIWEREQVVQECLNRMSRGEWYAGESHGILASLTGRSRSYVSDCASEANAILKREVMGHRDQVLPAILASIESIRKQALENQYRWTNLGGEEKSRPDPRFGDALKAHELFLKVSGLLSDKVQIEFKQPTQLWESARAWLREPDEELTQALNAEGWHRDPNWRADVVETTGESE